MPADPDPLPVARRARRPAGTQWYYRPLWLGVWIGERPERGGSGRGGGNGHLCPMGRAVKSGDL